MTEDSVKVCEAMFRVAVDERLKELLSNEYYRTQLGLEGGVIDDGPMNEAAWASRNDGKRVMWLLKEHNGPACTYDETASAYGVSHDRKRMYWDLHTKPDVFAGNVNYFKTLKLMELASRGILEENPHVRYEHVGKYAVSTFSQIAVLELGKTQGGSSTSGERLNLLVEAWGRIVHDQISAYGPDILIVAGPHFQKLFPMLDGRHPDCLVGNGGVSPVFGYRDGGMTIVKTTHPGDWRSRSVERRLEWVENVVSAVEKLSSRLSR